MITHLTATPTLATLGAKICPIAPPGAQQYADQLMGYVLWGIGLLFILGVVVGHRRHRRRARFRHAARLQGRRRRHRPGVRAIIGYLVLPGIVRAMTGSGCV